MFVKCLKCLLYTLCATCFGHTGPSSGNTQETHNQRSGTPNGAQNGRGTKYRKNRYPITSKLIIITTYFKSTIDKVHSIVDSLKKVLPEDGHVWPKHVPHKHRMHIYFNDILNILTNIILN
jgi:hypothetical protein